MNSRSRFPSTINIFYCYAREDKKLRDELESHLSAMKKTGEVTTWWDREIQPGMDWKREIDKHLKTSQIILLLVSHHFMASDYCYGVEMRQALERQKIGEARVIPIILSPVEWHETPIGELQALPTDGKAITTWHNRNEAFVDIVRGIRVVANEFLFPFGKSIEGAINHVLILTEDDSVGWSLRTFIRHDYTARGVTWLPSVEKAIHEANSEFKYDTVFIDVRENWRQKRWLILKIRDCYPLVPFVLVGSYEAFLSQLKDQDRAYFGAYYFLDIQSLLRLEYIPLITQCAQYLMSRRGEKYYMEKLYNVNLKEYQVQDPFIQNG
jgi:hypothetical protein